MIVHQYFYVDTRVRRYVEALANADVEVDVICVNKAGHTPDPVHSNIHVYRIPLSRFSEDKRNYLVEYALAFFWYMLWLLPLYLIRKHAVIHVHNMPDFLVFTTLIPRLMGARIILDIHDPMPEFYMSKYACKKANAIGRFMGIQEQLSVRFANTVITANDNFKRNLIRRGTPEEKITVINNVANTSVFDRTRYVAERQASREHFTMIYPGTFAPRYGLDIPIRALPRLISKIPHIRLLMIGARGGDTNDLIGLANELGVSAFVEIRPTLPMEHIPREMALADVGIYTALPDPHMNIATPTKVLEYAAMGIPVVAARLPVLENMFSERALRFFEPGNVAEFAAGVLELYEHPTHRAELVHNIDEQFLRIYGWENEIQKYFTLIKYLLEQDGRVTVS